MDGSPTEASFAQFKDIPIPSGASMNTERSLITGGQDMWLGRLVFTSFTNSTDIFDFYKNNAGQFGWNELASVRSKVSVLTYTRADRVMIVQIQDRWVMGSEVELTVTPRGSSSSSNSSMNSSSGSSSGGGVSSYGGASPGVGRAPTVPVQRTP
jgi:uncharacterized membrane protein YgcG